MRMHLRVLTDTQILERRQQREFPGPVEFELTRRGHELLEVGRVLQEWLRTSPHGQLELGGTATKGLTNALAEGWSAGIVRALASRPLSLTELSRLITGLSYPSLERRLGAMRSAGLIQRCEANGRGRPYELTPWMRRAVVPLAAAARWERKYLEEEQPPIRRLDIEAAFLMALPLASLPAGCSGVCRLAVDTSSASKHRQAGVLARIDSGRLTSCVTRLDGKVDASVTGSAASWMSAISHRQPLRLDLAGNRDLAVTLVESLRSGLATSA